jgi:hypothetical protein
VQNSVSGFFSHPSLIDIYLERNHVILSDTSQTEYHDVLVNVYAHTHTIVSLVSLFVLNPIKRSQMQSKYRPRFGLMLNT